MHFTIKVFLVFKKFRNIFSSNLSSQKTCFIFSTIVVQIPTVWYKRKMFYCVLITKSFKYSCTDIKEINSCFSCAWSRERHMWWCREMESKEVINEWHGSMGHCDCLLNNKNHRNDKTSILYSLNNCLNCKCLMMIEGLHSSLRYILKVFIFNCWKFIRWRNFYLFKFNSSYKKNEVYLSDS